MEGVTVRENVKLQKDDEWGELRVREWAEVLDLANSAGAADMGQRLVLMKRDDKKWEATR